MSLGVNTGPLHLVTLMTQSPNLKVGGGEFRPIDLAFLLRLSASKLIIAFYLRQSNFGNYWESIYETTRIKLHPTLLKEMFKHLIGQI